MRLSYSAISAFGQCPQKYQWQYVERIKVPPTQDQFFGILIHDILEYALKNDPVVPPLDNLMDLYDGRWNSSLFKGEISEREFYHSGVEIIKNFLSAHKPGLTTILETEKFFEIFWQGHKIVGKIDRVDRLPTGEIEIIDYKTNKKLPGEDDFNYDFQLPLYHWAAKTVWGDVDKIKLTLYFLRHNKKMSPPIVKSIEELQGHILKNVDSIQKSDFRPTPSKLCGWCEYLNRCEMGQKYLKDPQLKSGRPPAEKVKTDNSQSELNQASLF